MVSVNILIGLLLALACAVTTNVAPVLEHRGVNLAPSFCMSRPLRSTRQSAAFALVLLGSALMPSGAREERDSYAARPALGAA